jgi:hypothetical protein
MSVSDVVAARLRDRRRMVAVLVPAAYLVALSVTIATGGLPLARDRVLLWLVGGIAAFSVTSWRRLPQLLLDWAPIAALLVLYDLLRGAADSNLAAAHVLPQIDFDSLLSPVSVPTVWLQDHLYHLADPRWYDYLTWGTYMTHFFVPWVTLGVLWCVNRERFLQLRTLVIGLTFAAVATFALFPAMPPWLAGGYGHMPHVVRLVPIMWRHVGVHAAAGLWETGNGFVNLVAAIPSLHAGYPFLLMLFFWRSGRWARAGLALYSVAMGFSLVYGGEHFVLDVLLGWLYAGVVVAVVAGWRRWRRRRDAAAEPSAA